MDSWKQAKEKKQALGDYLGGGDDPIFRSGPYSSYPVSYKNFTGPSGSRTEGFYDFKAHKTEPYLPITVWKLKDQFSKQSWTGGTPTVIINEQKFTHFVLVGRCLEIVEEKVDFMIFTFEDSPGIGPLTVKVLMENYPKSKIQENQLLKVFGHTHKEHRFIKDYCVIVADHILNDIDIGELTVHNLEMAVAWKYWEEDSQLVDLE